MIKNNKGVTLISLTITIIVIIILTAIGLRSVAISIKDYRESKIKTELSIIRQFVIEQYQKTKATNSFEKPFGEPQSEFLQNYVWEGAKEIDFGDNKNINVKNEYTLSNLDTIAPIRPTKEQIGVYYILSPKNLPQLGFSNVKDTYIVNYKTGEVYNISKLDSEGRIEYYLPAIIDEEENDEQNKKNDTDFNDWTSVDENNQEENNQEGNGD